MLGLTILYIHSLQAHIIGLRGFELAVRAYPRFQTQEVLRRFVAPATVCCEGKLCDGEDQAKAQRYNEV
jgi:hypothetical protein